MKNDADKTCISHIGHSYRYNGVAQQPFEGTRKCKCNGGEKLKVFRRRGCHSEPEPVECIELLVYMKVRFWALKLYGHVTVCAC